MHFCIKCICNILCYKMYASNAFLHQMHFCTAEHFPKENVQQNKMYASNAFVTFCVTKCTHQMHLMPKCIFATHQIHFCIKYIFASNIFLHQIYFCITFCVTKCTQRTSKMYATQKVKKQSIAKNKDALRTFYFAKMYFCTNKMLQMHL